MSSQIKNQKLRVKIQGNASEKLSSLLEKFQVELCDNDENITIIDQKPESLEGILNKGSYGIISPELFSSNIGTSLISRFLGENLDFNLSIEDGRNLKMTDSLETGYFTDLIVTHALNSFSDEVALKCRSYFNQLSIFFLNLKSSAEALFPLEVGYGICDQSFIIQSHIEISSSSEIDFSDLSNIPCDILDIYFLEKNSRLVITGMWIQDENKQNGFFPSLFIQRNKLPNASLPKDHKTVQLLQDSHLKDQNVTDSLVQRILGLSTDEADEIIRVQGNGEGNISNEGESVSSLFTETSNETQVIEGDREDLGGYDTGSGMTEELSEQSQVIEGDREDLGGYDTGSGMTEDLSEQSQVIEGNHSDASSNWESKKLEIAEKIKEKASLIKGEKKDLAELDKEVIAIVSEVLPLSEGSSRHLVTGLFDGLDTSIETKESSILDIEVQRLKGELTQREDQLSRMKKVVNSMKEKLSLVLETNTGASEDDLKRGERSLEESRRAIGQLAENKDKEIEKLQKRVEELQGQQLDALGESSLQTKISQLEEENKQLVAQLDVAGTRISTMSKALDQQKQESSRRDNQELNDLNEKNKLAQSALHKFKEEKNLLQQENKKLEHKIRSLEEGSSGKDKAKDLEINRSLKVLEKEKDKEIQLLANNIRAMEESHKTAHIREKKLEQKLKFTIAQLEEAEKKAQRKSGPSKSPQDQKLLLKVKQLEKQNEKLALGAKKAQDDLVSKKKEALQLKSENTTLINRTQELERKLGLKKAS